MRANHPKTISEKILSIKSGHDAVAGDIVEADVDHVMVNDVTGPLAFQEFEALECEPVRDKIVLIPDHFVPNKDVASAKQAKEMRDFAKRWGIRNYFEVGRGGVCHQVMLDHGFAYPGALVVGADSHTCTYGGVNAFATGVGSSEAAAVFATGRLWFKVPGSIRVLLTGRPSRYVGGKDLVLKLISDIGVDGATYKALEFAGTGVASLSVSERLSVSNMAIEAGGKAGLFAADGKTLEYCRAHGRTGDEPIAADPGAAYWKELTFDVSSFSPQVACPHLPDNVRPVEEVSRVRVDQVVLGSCTNGRISDLREAAKVIRGRRVAKGVRFIVIPASPGAYSKALDEGLLRIFLDAGAIISPPTCGPCLGGHMGILAGGERCLSTTNRNFKGRMGSLESEVYLANPAVAAATAVTGFITHPSRLG